MFNIYLTYTRLDKSYLHVFVCVGNKLSTGKILVLVFSRSLFSYVFVLSQKDMPLRRSFNSKQRISKHSVSLNTLQVTLLGWLATAVHSCPHCQILPVPGLSLLFQAVHLCILMEGYCFEANKFFVVWRIETSSSRVQLNRLIFKVCLRLVNCTF